MPQCVIDVIKVVICNESAPTAEEVVTTDRTDSRETVDPEWMPNAISATDQDISPETVKRKWTDVIAVTEQDILPVIVTKHPMKALATTVVNQDTLHEIAHLPGNQVDLDLVVVAINPISLVINVIKLDTWLETARPTTSYVTTATNLGTSVVNVQAVPPKIDEIATSYLH